MRKVNSSDSRPGSKKVVRPNSTKSSLSKSNPRLNPKNSSKGVSTVQSHSLLSSDANVEQIMEERVSVTVLEGTLSKNGRVLNYMIRENPGTSFAISLFVVATKQKWSLYVPFSEDITELLRLWQIAPRYSNMSMIGTWLLSCSNVEFSNDVIINTSFDHFKFREKCVAQLTYFINVVVIKIQTVVRIFLARRCVGQLRAHRSKKTKYIKKTPTSGSYNSRRSRQQIHHSDKSLYNDDDERSILTEYSHDGLFLGGSLDAPSVDTLSSYHSHSSGNTHSRQRSRTVDLKMDANALKDRSRREQEVVAVYSNALTRTAPSQLRGHGTSKSSKRQRRVELKDSKDAMQSKLQSLRDEIGNVLIGFQEEIKGVKKSVVESSRHQSLSSSGLTGPNNVINEVAYICEAEMQPVKAMMSQVLQEISSLREGRHPVTPVVVPAERYAESSGSFNSDISALMTQMAQLQRQMTEQLKSNAASRDSASKPQSASNVVHESVLKAYKEKVTILEKSEAEKIKRIAALNFQLRRSSAAVSSKQRESYNEMMTTKAALEQAHGELEALRITLKSSEDEIAILKHAVANNRATIISCEVPQAEELKSQLQAERARVTALEKEKATLNELHDESLQAMAATLDESRAEVDSLKRALADMTKCSDVEDLESKLQAMTTKLSSSNTKISLLEDELDLIKREKLRLSDKLVQLREPEQDVGETEKNLRETVDALDRKLLESCDKQYHLQCKLESRTQALTDELARSMEKQNELMQTIGTFEKELTAERSTNEALRRSLRETAERLEHKSGENKHGEYVTTMRETRRSFAEGVAMQHPDVCTVSEAQRELEIQKSAAAARETAARSNEVADRLSAEDSQREATQRADEVAKRDAEKLAVSADREDSKADLGRLNEETEQENMDHLPVADAAAKGVAEIETLAAEEDDAQELEMTELLALAAMAHETSRKEVARLIAKDAATDACDSKSVQDVVNPRVAELLAIVGESQNPIILKECLAVAIAENSSALILKTLSRIGNIVEGVLAARPKSIMKVVQKIFPKLSVISVAVKQFAPIAAVQHAVLDIVLPLLTSSYSPGIAEVFGTSGLLEGFTAILSVHFEIVELCLRTFQGCQVMLEFHPANQVLLGTREFGDVIAAVLTVHNSENAIPKEVGQLLLTMCENCPPAVNALGMSAVAEALVICLSLQQHNIELCRLLVSAILALCPANHFANQLRFGTTQTFEVFINALSRNRGVDGLFKELCTGIVQICGKNEVIRSAIPGIVFANTLIDIFNDSGTPEKNLKQVVMLLYFALANESLRNDINDSGLDEALARLETVSKPSLAKAIGSCRRRASGLTSLSRSSSMSSNVSSDLNPENSLKGSFGKFLTSPTTIVAEGNSRQPFHTQSPSPQIATAEDVQSTDAMMEYGDVVSSSRQEKRSGTEKVRGSVLKLTIDKKKSRDNMRMVAMMEGMEKMYDPSIMTEIYKTAVAMDNRELCLKSLSRTDYIINEAKATKTYSPLVTFVIGDPIPLLAMLQHFIHDAEIQTVGLHTIMRMSHAGGGVEAFGSPECFQHIYHAMKIYSSNRDVMLVVLALAGRLTAKNPVNKIRASENDGFNVLVSTMCRFETDPALLDKFCRYICSCIDETPANADTFREAGGCQLLLSLLVRLPESCRDVSEALNVTVLNLCRQSISNQKFFSSAGCMKTCFKEMAAAITSASAMKFKHSCMLIFALLKFPEVSLPSLLKVKAPSKFMTILGATTNNDILVLTLLLVQSLCEFDSLNERFSELGIVDAMTKLTEGGKNSNLKKYCDAVRTSMLKARVMAPEEVEYNSQRSRM